MMNSILMIVLLAAVLQAANAHMEMKSPPPRKSRFGSQSGGVDYDNTAPLAKSASNFPCRGHKPAGSVLTVNAGDTIPVEITGGSPHDGGHCQWSLSYDDKNYVVVKTVMRECLRKEGRKFNVQIPSDAPAGKRVTFAWSWVNAVGNREFYMNCADISIKNSNANAKLSGPEMFVANLPSINSNKIPEFGGTGTGRPELYQQSKTLTVTGDGSASSGPPSAGGQPEAPATPGNPGQENPSTGNPSTGPPSQVPGGGRSQQPIVPPPQTPGGGRSQEPVGPPSGSDGSPDSRTGPGTTPGAPSNGRASKDSLMTDVVVALRTFVQKFLEWDAKK